MTTPTEVHTSTVQITVGDDGTIYRKRKQTTGDKTKPYLTIFDTLTTEEYATFLETL